MIIILQYADVQNRDQNGSIINLNHVGNKNVQVRKSPNFQNETISMRLSIFSLDDIPGQLLKQISPADGQVKVLFVWDTQYRIVNKDYT